jgi:hypothetical protein
MVGLAAEADRGRRHVTENAFSQTARFFIARLLRCCREAMEEAAATAVSSDRTSLPLIP